MKTSSCLLACLLSTLAGLAASTDPFSSIPPEQRGSLSVRLADYMAAYKGRKWDKLYRYVSDEGRGGANLNVFVAAMKSFHGTSFAQYPDLQEFQPNRSKKNDDGYDIYGCGKAQREGMTFKGVAVVHGVFEHQSWFFTGWSFTEFPNEPCDALSDPKWEPENIMGWSKPMEEIANFKQQGAPFHVDPAH